jgi:PAS domain S-box-containing protein
MAAGGALITRSRGGPWAWPGSSWAVPTAVPHEQMRGLDEESKLANDFLRLLLDTSSDVLVACDADNRVTFWNKAAIKRFRLSPTQAVGGELFDLVPALSFPALRAASTKVRKPGRGGRVTVKKDGVEYVFDPLPMKGKRRSYLLRVRPT